MQRFIISFIIFTVLLAIPPAALYYTGHAGILVNKFGTIFFFFSAITFMVSIAVIYINKKNQALLAQVFLVGTTAKIIFCMAFALVYLRVNHVNNIYFLVNFFYLYFLNTAFEVYSLLTNLRNSNFK